MFLQKDAGKETVYSYRFRDIVKVDRYCHPPNGGHWPKGLRHHLLDYNLIFFANLHLDKSVSEFLQNIQKKVAFASCFFIRGMIFTRYNQKQSSRGVL